MIGFIKYIDDMWQEYGFEILVILSIISIAICALCRLGKEGTYSKFFYYPEGSSSGDYQKPKPKDSKGEIICRTYLEKRFNKPFTKARPNFLRNPVTGGNFNLELDCFNPELKLAVEYNGVQHYKYVPYFHKNKEAFLNQKYRDEMKRVKCKENGIRLVEVPYDIQPHEIEHFLEEKLKFI